MGFIKLCWVLLGFTGFYWVLLGFTGFNLGLLSFTGFYRLTLQGIEFFSGLIFAQMISSKKKKKNRVFRPSFTVSCNEVSRGFYYFKFDFLVSFLFLLTSRNRSNNNNSNNNSNNNNSNNNSNDDNNNK